MDKFIYILSELKLAFAMPIAIIGISTVVYYFAKCKLKENESLYKFFRITKILFYIFIISFIGIEIAIIAYPKNNENKDDYIIVLGAGLDNGETPNLILSERLDAAIKCIKDNKANYIVLSGGQGADEKISESQAMSKYLQDRGIDRGRIIEENQSRNTNENIKYSKEKIEEHSHKPINDVSVKIVTTDFHAFRSSILAKKSGYVSFDNYSSSTLWYFIPSTYTREAFAVVKSMLLDKWELNNIYLKIFKE